MQLRCKGKVFEKRDIPVKDKKGKLVTKKIDVHGNDWIEGESKGRPTDVPITEEKEDWYDCNNSWFVRLPHVTDSMADEMSSRFKREQERKRLEKKAKQRQIEIEKQKALQAKEKDK